MREHGRPRCKVSRAPLRSPPSLPAPLPARQLCINENEGCEFIATNLDAVTHLTDAQEWAGNGAMTGAIKGCTGKEPTLVGKPSPLMIDYIVDKYGCQRDRICMVGDRLDTDILFGQNNGLVSCLTLSGVTTEEKLLSAENQIKPDYYVGSIAEVTTHAAQSLCPALLQCHAPIRVPIAARPTIFRSARLFTRLAACFVLSSCPPLLPSCAEYLATVAPPDNRASQSHVLRTRGLTRAPEDHRPVTSVWRVHHACGPIATRGGPCIAVASRRGHDARAPSATASLLVLLSILCASCPR